VLRLSCAIEENGLLAMARRHRRTVVAAGYFANLATDRNTREEFKDGIGRASATGHTTLNALGHRPTKVFHSCAVDWRREELARKSGSTACGPPAGAATRQATPIYLAQAEGLSLAVVQKLDSR